MLTYFYELIWRLYNAIFAAVDFQMPSFLHDVIVGGFRIFGFLANMFPQTGEAVLHVLSLELKVLLAYLVYKLVMRFIPLPL